MTSMWQSIIVVLLVLAAAAYVGRRLWRTLRPARTDAPGCDAGCGCSATSAGAESGSEWARTH